MIDLTTGGASADATDARSRLADALQAVALAPAESSLRARVLALLVDAQVLAAVSATATGEHVDAGTGLRAESGAELAVLLLETAGGDRALPVFTGTGELQRWRLDARPVPLTGPQACAAALDEGAGQLVLDPAGAALVLERQELAAIADGWVPVPGAGGLSTRTSSTEMAQLTAPDPAAPSRLVSDLREALSGEGLLAASLLQRDGRLVLGVAARSPLSPAQLAGLAQRLLGRMGARLPEGGLDLLQVPPGRQGQVVLGARHWWLPGRGRSC